jgi:hypothetical protein
MANEARSAGAKMQLALIDRSLFFVLVQQRCEEVDPAWPVLLLFFRSHFAENRGILRGRTVRR